MMQDRVYRLSSTNPRYGRVVAVACHSPRSYMLRGEYWNYIRAQFGGVCAFDYNSTDSEPI